MFDLYPYFVFVRCKGICTDSPEPLLLAEAISFKISCTTCLNRDLGTTFVRGCFHDVVQTHDLFNNSLEPRNGE